MDICIILTNFNGALIFLKKIKAKEFLQHFFEKMAEAVEAAKKTGIKFEVKKWNAVALWSWSKNNPSFFFYNV